MWPRMVVPGPECAEEQSHHPYGARATFRALTGLDFGLRVRVTSQSQQRTLFSGSQNLSAQELTSEQLAEMVSELRVRSFAVRGQLEQVTSALQANVQCGAWRYAQRAALDLAALLTQTGKRASPRPSFACAEPMARCASPSCAAGRCCNGRPGQLARSSHGGVRLPPQTTSRRRLRPPPFPRMPRMRSRTPLSRSSTQTNWTCTAWRSSCMRCAPHWWLS
jgi:hypothetical protein